MKPANPCILTINGGSSSIKFALFEAGDVFRNVIDFLEWSRHSAEHQSPRRPLPNRGQAVTAYEQVRRLAYSWYSLAARLILITWPSGSDSVGFGRINNSPAEAVNLTVRSLPPAVKARPKPQ